MTSALLQIRTVPGSDLYIFRDLSRLPSLVTDFVLRALVLGPLFGALGWCLAHFWSLLDRSDWSPYPPNSFLRPHLCFVIVFVVSKTVSDRF